MVGTTVIRAMSQLRETPDTWEEPMFRQLFREHYGRVVGVLVRLLGDRSHAEEVANDAFLKLYRQPASLQVDGNVGGWLYRTATNLGIDALRAGYRRKKYEQAAAGLIQDKTQPGPLDDVLHEENCRHVRAVLSSIKPTQAQLLILRSSGLSYKELAEALEVKPGNVGTMLNRAEVEFRTRYIEMYGLRRSYELP
jgi:RNA polymerase sigma-70 factor (ECF subfamily)